MAQRRKLYRTMQGRMVDIEKLRSANEGVQAVGNMNVNGSGRRCQALASARAYAIFMEAKWRCRASLSQAIIVLNLRTH